MLIYVADDEHHICLMIKRQLEHNHHNVMTFCNGLDLLKAYEEKIPDIVVTDIMMPQMDGYELCKRIREISDIPLIILSARGSEEDRIKGLEIGVDDYLPKPFSLKELELKIAMMTKRYRKSKSDEKRELIWENIILNRESHDVVVDQKNLQTTEKEFQFLELLMLNKNKAYSREEIIEIIWGYEFLEDTRMLDHLVKRLRKKLTQMNCKGQIETIWGYGFKVSDHED